MIIYHPKVIICPRVYQHLFNIFTLKNDLRTFAEKCHESHMCAFMGQILQDARIRGWGGRPNFGNARILGAYGPPTHPLRKKFFFQVLSAVL